MAKTRGIRMRVKRRSRTRKSGGGGWFCTGKGACNVAPPTINPKERADAIVRSIINDISVATRYEKPENKLNAEIKELRYRIHEYAFGYTVDGDKSRIAFLRLDIEKLEGAAKEKAQRKLETLMSEVDVNEAVLHELENILKIKELERQQRNANAATRARVAATAKPAKPTKPAARPVVPTFYLPPLGYRSDVSEAQMYAY